MGSVIVELSNRKTLTTLYHDPVIGETTQLRKWLNVSLLGYMSALTFRQTRFHIINSHIRVGLPNRIFILYQLVPSER